MAHWKNILIDYGILKADRPTDYYYEKIDAEMKRRPRPTVGDAIAYMCKLGNRVFARAHGVNNETPFVTPSAGIEFHEISHLAGRFGHVLQQETFMLAFEQGLQRGTDVATGGKEEIEDLHYKMKTGHEQLGNREMRTSRNDWRNKLPSNANRAVNFALGIYLRQKIEAFNAQTWPTDETKRYDTQRTFSEHYADADGVPVSQQNVEWETLNEAPYALIQLSGAEWRACAAVALGLAPPKQTKYPERMEAVKQALDAAGLAYDRPASMAAREEGRRIQKETETAHRA